MNLSVMAIDRMNDLVTIVSHNAEKGIENEYQATFEIISNGDQTLVSPVGPAYHLESEIRKEEILKEVKEAMIGFVFQVFNRSLTGRISSEDSEQISLNFR